MPDYEKSGIWVVYPRGRVREGERAAGAGLRVLLVGIDPEYLARLRSAFEPEAGIEIAGEVGSGPEALAQAQALRPDTVVIDLDAPGIEGMETTRRLAGDQPGIDVVVLTAGLDRERLHEARRAGASAFVVKDAAIEVLLQTIRDLSSGERPMPREEVAAPALEVEDNPEPPGPVIGPAGTDGEPEFTDDLPARPDSLRTDFLLTSNERTILRLLGEGLNNDRIGHKTGLQSSMVSTYLSEIYRKLGLSGRDEAMQYARERLGSEDD